MAKGTVKVTKGKDAPAGNGDVGTSPQPFGRLFEPLASMRRDIDRFFESLAPSFPRGIDFDPLSSLSSVFELGRGDLTPHVEVTEEKKGYEITAELPGVDEKDMNVTLQDHTLIVSGEKKSERKEEKKDYYLSERSYGSFRRSFRLPEEVNEDKISAKFEKGVMTIFLPRVASAKPKGRQIPIR